MKKPRVTFAKTGLLSLALAAVACQGSIDPVPDPGAAPPTKPGPGGQPSPGGPPPSESFPPAPSCAAAGLDPGPMFLRRLSNPEYQQTMRDLVGETGDVTSNLPGDVLTDGFDTSAENNNVSPLHFQQWNEIAERVAAGVMSNNTRRAAVVGCDLADAGKREACLRTFIERFGRRAFRRPLSTEEKDGLFALAMPTLGTDPNLAARVVIAALLQSPSFLYRPEVGVADPRRPGLARLTGFEVATRLSYMFFRTTPDDALLDEAAAGRLDTPEGVEARAVAMLRDPRAKSGLRSFYEQWLRLRLLDNVERDAAEHPGWTEGLIASMKEEAVRLIEPLAFTPNADFLSFLTTREVQVDKTLATLYGVPAPASGWGKVTLDGQVRGGFLSLASFLVPSANGARLAIPIHRGLWIRDALLCDAVPPPPPDVPDLAEGGAGQSDRERLQAHSTNPTCAACHRLLDPLGFGLSGFDAVGKHRTKDEAGRPIDTKGTIYGTEDGDFEGPVALGQKLKASTKVAQCLSTQWLRYTLGRDIRPTDSCLLEHVTQVFRGGGNRLQDLTLAFVRSDAFRYRQTAAAQKGEP
jgi:hypothetical protein